MPEEYIVDLQVSIMADSKIEAMEKIKNMLDGMAECDITEDMESALFAELGIDWEV